MKVAVVGSREFCNYSLLCSVLSGYAIDVIISGGARGADSLAAKYATENEIQLVEYLADWKKHGKSAGFIRNTLIVENADIVIAFWDMKSNGTRDSINKARSMGKEVVVIDYTRCPIPLSFN